MNKFGKYLIIALLALFVGFVVVQIVKGPKIYQEVDLSFSDNTIMNYSGIMYADTLAHIGLDALEVSDVTLYIMKGQSRILQNIMPDQAVDGFVVRLADDTFQIFLNPELNRRNLITILAHELVHVKQYVEGDLQDIGPGQTTYKSQMYNLENIDYDMRPWETEAYQLEGRISRNIRQVVFQ